MSNYPVDPFWCESFMFKSPMQSSVRWGPTSLWNIMSARVAGSAPSRIGRVSWSVIPAPREPPRPTCTPAASRSAKVRSCSLSYCSVCV